LPSPLYKASTLLTSLCWAP